MTFHQTLSRFWKIEDLEEFAVTLWEEGCAAVTFQLGEGSLRRLVRLAEVAGVALCHEGTEQRWVCGFIPRNGDGRMVRIHRADWLVPKGHIRICGIQAMEPIYNLLADARYWTQPYRPEQNAHENPPPLPHP